MNHCLCWGLGLAPRPCQGYQAGQVALTAGRMGLRVQGDDWGRLAAWPSLWLELLLGS